MSTGTKNQIAISGENACVVLWVAQAVVDRGFQAVIHEDHTHLLRKFFGTNPLILSQTTSQQWSAQSHILIKAKTDHNDEAYSGKGRLVVAAIGFSPEELVFLAKRLNSHRTVGADIVFGPGCHGLPHSGLTKGIGSAFNGKGFRLPYTGERCYAYVEDFACAAVEALLAPSPSNYSPSQIGELASIEEILRDLEYVFPYNGITAHGPRTSSPFDDARLLPHSILQGIEKSQAVLKQMSRS